MIAPAVTPAIHKSYPQVQWFFAFGFILGVFPAFIGLVLIVPSTLYRTVFVFAQKPEQTLKEKVILSLGLLITLLCFSALIKLAFT